MAKSGSGGGRGAGGGGGAASSAETAQAEADLASAQSKEDLLNKAYSKRNELTAKEQDQVRRITGGKPVYPFLKQAREDKFAAEERLKALRGENGSTAATRVQTGIMSSKEAYTPLTAAERQLATSTLFPNNAKTTGRIQLAAGDRDNLARQLQQGKRSGTLPQNLSLTEFAAIRSYTGNGYIGMNAAAQGRQVDGSTNLAQRQRVTARLANQGLQKLANHSGTKYQGEVQRFTRMPKAEVAEYAPGRTVTFNGVTSTTTGGSNAAGSYGGGGGGLTKASSYGSRASAAGVKMQSGSNLASVEYRINVKSGANISTVSGRAFEKEVALSHGFQGRISNVERSGNKTIVYMDEI